MVTSWLRRRRAPSAPPVAAGGRIRLAQVDELLTLPRFDSVRALMKKSVTRGHCDVLPGLERRANDWFPDCVEPWSGDGEPPPWGSNPVVPCPPVHLFRLREAFYFPAWGVVVSAEGEAMKRAMEEAAYATPDLAALPRTQRLGADTYLDRDGEVETLERAAVTLPWGATSGNYGHFVLDGLCGAAVVRSQRELDGYPLIVPPLREWQRRHFQLAGLATLEAPGDVYRVRDLVFPSCMAHFLHDPNLAYRTLRERQLPASRPAPRRALYVSRGDRPHRRFRSEEPLQAALRERGFAVMAPEEHPVEAQIEMFSTARVVVGHTGAALANALYCSPGAVVVEIRNPLMAKWWLAWVCAIVGLRWRPYLCADVTLGAPPMFGGVARPEANFEFDTELEQLLRFIDRAAAG